nr:RNA polymerase beta'' subunit [Chlorococcum sp. KSF0227]
MICVKTRRAKSICFYAPHFSGSFRPFLLSFSLRVRAEQPEGSSFGFLCNANKKRSVATRSSLQRPLPFSKTGRERETIKAMETRCSCSFCCSLLVERAANPKGTRGVCYATGKSWEGKILFPLSARSVNKLKAFASKRNPFGENVLTESFTLRKQYTGKFFNQCFDKGRLKNFVLWFLLNYGEHKTVRLVEQLKNVGFEYASRAGISLGIDDLKIPPKKANLIYDAENQTNFTVNQYVRGEITGVERFQRLIDTWHRTSEVLKQEVIDYFEATDILNPVYMMAFSGARGNISQVRQLVGMRGLMADPQGQIIDFPIRSNFREGLTLTEYIISSYGARKGIVDTALRTANAGYLTRRLVDVAQHVIISNFDCGTNRGIFLTNMKEGNKTIHSLSQRIVGRILARDLFTLVSQKEVPIVSFGKEQQSSLKQSQKTNLKIASRNEEVTLDLAFEIGKKFDKVFVRSPLTCEKLICQLCYGWSLAQGGMVSIGEAVGVVAAQSIGEPGTQLTMRTFHTGGVFSGDVSDQIKAPFDGVIQYISAIPGTLIRTPEGKIAFLTKSEGSFLVKKTSGLLFETLSLQTQQVNSVEIKKFTVPHYTLLYIRNGQNVYEKEVIAQISSISQKTNATDDAELTIKSEIEGQFYSKFLGFREKIVGPAKLKLNKRANQRSGSEETPFVSSDEGLSSPLWSNQQEKIYEAWTWGYAWILSGKIYDYKNSCSFQAATPSLPIVGDLLNTKSHMTQTKWSLSNHNGTSVSFYYHKRTPSMLSIEIGSVSSVPVKQPFGYLPSRFFGEKGAVPVKGFASLLVAKQTSRSLWEKEGEKGMRVSTKAESNKQSFKTIPSQATQILFIDINHIFFKKYGYVLEVSKKNQFNRSLVGESNESLLSLPLPFLQGSGLFQQQSKINDFLFFGTGAAPFSKKEQGQLRRSFEDQHPFLHEPEPKFKMNSVHPASVGLSPLQPRRSQSLLNQRKDENKVRRGLGFSSEGKEENRELQKYQIEKLPYIVQWFPHKYKSESGGFIIFENGKFSKKSPFFEKSLLFSSSFPLEKGTEEGGGWLSSVPKEKRDCSASVPKEKRVCFATRSKATSKPEFCENPSLVSTTITTNKQNIEHTYVINRHLLLKTREIKNSKILLIPSDVFKIATGGSVLPFSKWNEGDFEKRHNSNAFMSIFLNKKMHFLQKNRQGGVNLSSFDFLLPVFDRFTRNTERSKEGGAFFPLPSVRGQQKSSILLKIKTSILHDFCNKRAVKDQPQQSTKREQQTFSFLPRLCPFPQLALTTTPKKGVCFAAGTDRSLLCYSVRSVGKETSKKGKRESNVHRKNRIETKLSFFKKMKFKNFTSFCKTVCSFAHLSHTSQFNRFSLLGSIWELFQQQPVLPEGRKGLLVSLSQQQKHHEYNRVLLFLNSIYVIEKTITVCNYLEKFYTKFKTVKNKLKFYSFVFMQPYQTNDFEYNSNHYVTLFFSKKILLFSPITLVPVSSFPFSPGERSVPAANQKKVCSLLSALSSPLGKSRESSKATSREVFALLFEKQAAKQKRSNEAFKFQQRKEEIVFHGTAKKGWVYVTSIPFLNIESKPHEIYVNKFSKYLKTNLLLTMHKKLIYAGQPVFNEITFHTSVFAESFLLKNIFNIKKVFSFSKIVSLQEIENEQTNYRGSYSNKQHPPSLSPFPLQTREGVSHSFAEREKQPLNGHTIPALVSRPEGFAALSSPLGKSREQQKEKRGQEGELLTNERTNGQTNERMSSVNTLKWIINKKCRYDINQQIKTENNSSFIGYLFQPIKEFEQMNNFELKKYTYESTINVFNNSYKKIMAQNSFSLNSKKRNDLLEDNPPIVPFPPSSLSPRSSPANGALFPFFALLRNKQQVAKQREEQENSNGLPFYIEKQHTRSFFKELLLLKNKYIEKLANTFSKLENGKYRRKEFAAVPSLLFPVGKERAGVSSLQSKPLSALSRRERESRGLLCSSSNEQWERFGNEKHRLVRFKKRKILVNQSFDSLLKFQQFKTQNLVSLRETPTLSGGESLFSSPFQRSSLFFLHLKSKKLVEKLFLYETLFFMQSNKQIQNIFSVGCSVPAAKAGLWLLESKKGSLAPWERERGTSSKAKSLLLLPARREERQSTGANKKTIGKNRVTTKTIDQKVNSYFINSLLLFIICSIQKPDPSVLQKEPNKEGFIPIPPQPTALETETGQHSAIPKRSYALFNNIKDLKALLRASSVKQLIGKRKQDEFLIISNILTETVLNKYSNSNLDLDSNINSCLKVRAGEKLLCMVSRKQFNVSPFLIHSNSLPALPSFSRGGFFPPGAETKANGFSLFLREKEGIAYSPALPVAQQKRGFAAGTEQREGFAVQQAVERDKGSMDSAHFTAPFGQLRQPIFNFSYLPISKFDCYLYPLLSFHLSSILNFYLCNMIQKKKAVCSSAVKRIFKETTKVLNFKENLQNTYLYTQKNNHFFSYAIFNSFINNVFESPCFSFNLVKFMDLSAFKKTKTQTTQFLYGNDLNQNFASLRLNPIGACFATNKEQHKVQSSHSLFNQNQQIQAKTNYYSPFKGEIVYAQTIAPKDKLLLNDRLITGPTLFDQKKYIRSTTGIDSFSYSCMFLTKNDLISYYLPHRYKKQESTKTQNLFNVDQNYYEINNTLIKSSSLSVASQKALFALSSPAKQPSSPRVPFGEEVIVGKEPGNDSPFVSSEGSVYSTENQIIQISKTQAGKPRITGSPFRISNYRLSCSDSQDSFSSSSPLVPCSKRGFAALPHRAREQQKETSKAIRGAPLLGDFYAYGDPISKLASLPESTEQRAIQVSGQVIHYNRTKITIRRAQPVFISPKGILHKFDGDFIDPKSPVITLSYQRLKTGDIIQGIPKVEQFFEARTTKRGRLFRDSLPSLLKALFKRYQSKIPLELAVRQSFYKIQQIIVDGVQRVYKSQGVTISDKHLEVIVKQMTSKVRIIDGAQTGFFPGEVVDLFFVEKINQFLIKKITYEPVVLGITKASLEVDSFLSASSFQQTTRVLSQAAIYRKKDFLKGLKENVILGNLIPAGTGYLVYLDDF